MLVTRRCKAIVVAALSTALLGGGVAVAARGAHSAPKGGQVGIFVTNIKGPDDKIMIAGAIGDYGKSITVNKNGKANNNGNYEKVKLQKGTFVVNVTKLNHLLNTRPKINKATCSVYVTKTHAVSLSKGTGLYAGISGHPKITVSFAFLAPRVKSGKHKGQCDFRSNTKPLSHFSSIQGGGTVSFS